MFKLDNSRISRMRDEKIIQPAISVERTRYMTESYRQTEGEPYVIRRAKAFKHILENISVIILKDDIIVGQPSDKTRGGSISPEVRCDWILDEMDSVSERDTDPYVPLTEEEKDVLRDSVSYWQGNSVYDHFREIVSDDAMRYDGIIFGGGGFSCNNQHYGHLSADFGMLLELGTDGIIAKIDEQLSKAEPDLDKVNELAAMKISMEGLSIIGERYAAKAREMAEAETDAERKAELLAIAAVCDNVPKRPAKSFHEALQSTWFAYMGMMLENWGTGNTLLRVDQYLWPYYEHDIASGIIDKDEALMLVCGFYVAINFGCIVYSEATSHGFAGANSGTAITIGGVDAEGNCAVNELSYIFMEGERRVNMTSDDVVIRINDNTPNEFLLEATRLAKDLGGKLKFVGDKTTIKNLMIDAVPEAEANDYAIAGCTSPVVGGKGYNIPGGIISSAGILELALNNGVQRMTGQKIGLETGNPAEFETYEQLWDAFEQQVRYVIPYLHEIKNADKQAFATYRPSPFESAMCPVCIERGKDLTQGGTAPHVWYAMSVAGLPNVGNSLAAIKKYVFEEKKVSMQMVLDALEANFEGYEDLRILLCRAPKWGNNDSYVDDIVNRAVRLFSEVVEETPGFNNAHSTIAAAAVTANVGLGMCLGATPEGRFAGESLADGGISPTCGTNDSGMTATMMSIAHLPHECLRHGEVLNIRLDPDAINNEAKLEKFASLIRSYIRSGGFLVQFNIVGTDTLKDAMVHPELHRDLVVRVATYAAYFIELGEGLQQDIIKRMEFESV